MPIYKYRAITEDKKTVSGLVEAPAESIAIDILKDRELEIISLSLKSAGKGWDINSFLNKVKPKDIVVFSRQFSVLISAGVALVSSLKILIEQTENITLKTVVSEIADEVDGGARLSDSLAKRTDVFSEFYINVVKSGETSGKLDEVLNYLADELEKDYDMASKIKGAMIYPAFVLSALVVVGAIMMMFLVPKLTSILTETGTELPMATKLLMGTSDFMVNYWWFLLILVIALPTGFKFSTRVPAIKAVYDYMILRLPIFGKLFRRIYLVRFTRSMQTLLVGGVNLSKGLTITAEIVSNSVYKNLILETKKEIEDGNSISSVFADSSEIPKMVSQMLSIGEKAGKLDSILGSVTEFYTREIDNIVANLMTLLEPIIMIIMGVAVGFMVAAVIMPMYNMASGF
ncbi:hypothetical protein DRH27_02735 [Candidatus Falkowbacteria bacterium]|nr:MAG: hypothetical protein DRH27_02735 [Candidatus Falkowbacteria bacterium]